MSISGSVCGNHFYTINYILYCATALRLIHINTPVLGALIGHFYKLTMTADLERYACKRSKIRR